MRHEALGGQHLADVDVMVQIRSSGQFKTADVINANDQPDGPLTTFKLDVCKLGFDDDGDEITAAIVSHEICKASTTANEPKLTGNQLTLYTLLYDAR